MPEIGETLRDARMQARIDISDVEQQTKIRAKYLRALENEEWDLLPGPTFVRSFLRTYAQALGLDDRLLVDEFRRRHERVEEPQRPVPATPGKRRRRPSGRVRMSRNVAGASVVIAAVVALWGIGQLFGSDEPTTSVATTPPTAPAVVPPITTPAAATSPSQSRRTVRVQIIPTADVYVCLVAARRTLINGEVLERGVATRTFAAPRFLVNLGNSNVRLKINGRMRTVPRSDEATGYVITPRGRRSLPAGERPDCA